ncbi:hypothetical protein [Streptomyces sp. NPDC007940]|uniref:hypothetical protein n=1 Tax=Streptomyces sp. NPDC007940 TaxID=3364796 RepID=UPI0036EA4FCD
MLHNTGAKPIVVQDLRLCFPEDGASIAPLSWTSTRSHLRPETNDALKLPAGFAVPGRGAEQLFIEFGTEFPHFTPEARDYRVSIEAKLGHRKGWRSIITFNLHVARITDPSRYIAYKNSLEDVTDEQLAASKSAFEELAAAASRRAVVKGEAESNGPDADAGVASGSPDELRVLVHRGYFLSNASQPATGVSHFANESEDGAAEEHFFIRVTNFFPWEVELEYIWFATNPEVHLVRPERPLPARLRSNETFEAWIPVSEVPQETDLEGRVRVRLSDSSVFKSRLNHDVPPEGFTARPGNS